MKLRRRFLAIFFLQIILVVLSAAAAWLLRFDFAFPHASVFFFALPLLLWLRCSMMARFNLFHGYWRYTGVSDALNIFKAVAIGSFAFFAAERWVVGNKNFPMSVYFIEAILTMSSLAGVRVLCRALLQSREAGTRRNKRKKVIVIGAGCAGAMLLRELPRSGYSAVALLDDDPAKAGVTLHGVPVRGTVSDLPQIVCRYSPDEVMIAIPSASGEQMQRIAGYFEHIRLPFRTIPGLGELINGTVTVDQLREVNLEDLLGRESVRLNLDSVTRRIAGRVVMVTGAAGSIGSELSDQLLRYGPKKLVFVDQAETPLFYLQNAIAELDIGSKVEKVYCVADFADSARMRDIIREHEIRAIFHAAAYKHVPLMEENLEEALKNNVFGLLSLLEVADRSGCEDFLLISSDKAVSPTSFMGCTKRIGELIIAARPPARMRCLSVRFGNVLGSQGSVIPIFQKQIKNKRPITITHPDITRYFMTIAEAVSLVLQAFSIGDKGDILVLDMGKPVRILDMAKTLIRLSGVPEDQVRIVFTGLRPGEKLFEDLFYEFERKMSTPAQKVLRTQGPILTWPNLRSRLIELRAASLTGVSARIRAKVKEIVPQYQWTPPVDNPYGRGAHLVELPSYQGKRGTRIAPPVTSMARDNPGIPSRYI
jgi:FlaA1/EpsC-like NDP-sugar epimerase